MSSNTIKKNTYTRVGSVRPSEELKEKLDALRDEYVLDDPPETIGGNIDDEESVIECMNAAAEFMHSQLPDREREHAKEKWGLTDDIIDAREIGYVTEDSGFIGYLISEGFDKQTIVRASLATKAGLKHLFECNGVAERNKDLLPENRREAECNGCYHQETPTETIETLVRAQIQGLITPEEINFEAIFSHIENNMTRHLRNWWDSRITFPYKDNDGNVRYFIVRATRETDDQVYNNGVIDRRNATYTRLSELPLGRDLKTRRGWECLDEFYVIPNITRAYKSPKEIENEPVVEDIEQVLEEVIDVGAPVDDAYLQRLGLSEIDGADRPRVHVFESSQVIGEYETQYVVTPAAIGIRPGGSIDIVNHTAENTEVIVQPCETPDGAWWEENATNGVKNTVTYTCDETGMYKYKLKINGEEHQAAVVVDEYIDTESRDEALEQWCDDEPLFEVDVAKYLKQAVSHDWVNNGVVDEPIFGMQTIHEDTPAISAEGIADAIAAQQHNIPAVSSAAAHYKDKHFNILEDVCEKASMLVIVNDNDEAGQRGAVRTASEMHNRGYENVKIGQLPPEEEAGELDVAEYLKQHGDDARKEFLDEVLSDLINPQDHEFYDEVKHGESNQSTGSVSTSNGGSGDNSTYDGEFETVEDWRESDRSSIYDIPLGEVINFDALNTSGGSELFRGGNPTTNENANATDNTHFRIKQTGDGLLVQDFKKDHTYNALEWLAVMAECDCENSSMCDCTRSADNPGKNTDGRGILSNSETWWVWKYVNEANHIEYPEDDSVPAKAIWFLAEYHDVWPSEEIPDSFDDPMLDRYAYNEVLELITEEYELNPSRQKLSE